MGWNGVDWKLSARDPMLRGLADGDQFYFVHSYHLCDEDKRLEVMKTHYEYPFTSGISHNNCFATQFHPEKVSRKVCNYTGTFLKNLPVMAKDTFTLFTPSVMADTANLEIGDQKYSLNLIKEPKMNLLLTSASFVKSRVITLTMAMEIQVPAKATLLLSTVTREF